MSVINLNKQVGIRQKSLSINLRDSGGHQILVVYEVGSLSDQDVFRAIATKNFVVEGEQAQAVLNGDTSGGTVFEELQAALIAELESRPDWLVA